MRQKKIVVTGGAGFIGSNIVEEISRHNEVIIIDDLSSGRLENLAEVIQYDNVRFCQGNILDNELLEKNFQGVDIVFHLAAVASVARSISDPILVNEVNIKGTLNVLIAASDNGVKKVVFASSAAVYGDAPILPVKENMIPKLHSPYAVTKLTGEYYCQIFSELYRVPTVCLRYFNVYGPRQKFDSEYSSVIPSFIRSVLMDKSPVIYGDGNQSRDFVFIGDVVRANLIAAEKDVIGILNVASGSSTTINKLAQELIKIQGGYLKPIHKESRPGEVRNSVADLTKANSIGYYPKYSLEQGLRETFESMKPLI